MSDNTNSIDHVVEEFKRYELFHRDRFEEAKKVYEYWLNKPVRKFYDWQNSIHVPMTIGAEQTITPRLHQALFPNEAPVEVVVEQPGTPEQGIIIRDTIKHHFRLSDVQGEGLSALTQTSLFGTGYVYAPWLVERMWQVNPLTLERYEAVVSNRPDCQAVSFFDIFPHPAKLNVKDPLPLIRRSYCDAEYLKSLAENPNFKFDNLSDALNSHPVITSQSVILDQYGKPSVVEDRKKYEILEYWGPWDQSITKNNVKTTKKFVPHWIMVVNRKVKIRQIPNPYNHQRPPFCKLILFTDPNPCWFGIGIGKIGKPTQERLNKIVNQRLDNVDLVLNKQGFFNGNDPLINTKKLQVAKPGQWHRVSDTVTSIRWMDTPDVTASSYKEEEIAKQDFRESTGATIPLMPTDQGQHRTAMGINLLQGAAGMRFRSVLRRLETDFIQDLSQMYLSMLQQFMSLPEWIRVTSDNGKSEPILVRPEDIQRKAVFMPMGISETLNKEVMIGQLLRFKELTINDPTVNRVEINKRLADLMGFRDIPALLTPQQPVQVQPGGLPPQMQQRIQQRVAEGATPEQIKLEMLGQPPEGVPMEAPAGA